MNNQHKDLIKTARLTGLFYLLLALTGVFGFLIYHSKVYEIGNAAKTLSNITNNPLNARVRLLFELGIVVSQAFTAIWFYKLFRPFNKWAATTLAIWGTVNSVIIMVSAMAMGCAIAIAPSVTITPDGKLVAIEVMQQIITNAWGVGNVFFGLWLLPMGYVVVESRVMPVWLGRVLLIGGAGYVLSAFVNYAGYNSAWTGLLTVPASVGEFWMIGYLVSYGVRKTGVGQGEEVWVGEGLGG